MRQFQSLYEAGPPQGGVDLETLAAIADAHAAEVWRGDFARGEPFPVVDANETIFAYVFPYALGVRTFPSDMAQAVQEPGQTGQFGSIYVAAQRTKHPVLRVTYAPHPLFSRGEEAQRATKSMTDTDARISKIYWLGMHQEYFEVSAGDRRLLMDVRNLKQVDREPVLKRGIATSARGERDPYWNVEPPRTMPKQEVVSDEEFNEIVKRLTSPAAAARDAGGGPRDFTLLKLVQFADCVPAVNWTWWCVPTAFTMAACYYDNYSKSAGGFIDYGRLAGYWFDHPKSGHNVPDFINQLIDPATENWRTGFNGFPDFIKKTYGYDFKTREVTASAANDWAWEDIVAEIDAGRPFCWGTRNHATCAFGYRVAPAGKFVVHHTTWGDTPAQQRDEWLYTRGEGMTAIIPGGGTPGHGLALWEPDGGETLLTGIPTKIRWHIWGDQIKTAEILVSADGGNTWTSIRQAAPCAPGWNYHDWAPQVATDRARVRIRGLSANGQYVAGDGSQQNIKVVPAMRPVTLVTFVIQAKTNAQGYFSVPHGLERYTPDGFAIRAISVAVQHNNSNWHTLELSHQVDNRFWWNKDVVAGLIASPNFSGRDVRIVIFAEHIVG